MTTPVVVSTATLPAGSGVMSSAGGTGSSRSRAGSIGWGVERTGRAGMRRTGTGGRAGGRGFARGPGSRQRLPVVEDGRAGLGKLPGDAGFVELDPAGALQLLDPGVHLLRHIRPVDQERVGPVC